MDSLEIAHSLCCLKFDQCLIYGVTGILNLSAKLVTNFFEQTLQHRPVNCNQLEFADCYGYRLKVAEDGTAIILTVPSPSNTVH